MSQTTMIAMLEEAEAVLRGAGCDVTADKVRGVLQAQQAEPVAWHTNDPCVSSEHIEAIAKVCKIIPSYTTVEYVARIVGFGHVLLADKSVQEAFVRANSHLLRTDTAQPPAASRGRGRAMLAAAPQGATLSAALADIAAERRRQIEQEGWTPGHDDEHACDEIAAFAALYAMPPACRDWPAAETGYGATLGEAMLPHSWQAKFGDRRRELVKAGALIAAEIERLDRAAQKGGEA